LFGSLGVVKKSSRRFLLVIAGLDPAIHHQKENTVAPSESFPSCPLARTMRDEQSSHWDHRVKPGDDEWKKALSIH